MTTAPSSKRYRVFVLGAGFSIPAGFPDANELWTEVRLRASTGPANHLFDRDLRKYIAYRQACDGLTLQPDGVNFEDFMRFLDIEHFLGLRGSETWSRHGNEGTVIVKTLIGQILAERTPASAEIPKLYLDFARGLQPDDYVLTFNYDVLLEQALDAVGTPYRLFPNRLSNDGVTIDDSKNEVIVLKLHGSIDWFDRTSYTGLERTWREGGSCKTPPDVVFAHADELSLVPLVDGPGFEADPLGQMYRVGELKALYQKPIMLHATPWLLAPSTVKFVYAETIKEFFYGLSAAGAMNFGVSIMGYSLPPQDEYARQILYSIVRNYQNMTSEYAVLGLKRTPLVVVTRCADTADADRFKARYRFVDWSRAILHDRGLDETAIRLALASE